MAAYLSPVFGAGAQLFSNQGVVLSGGKIQTYQAGTTTPLGTWTDSTQVTSNANPIILDSAGRLPNEIWLQASSTYKFVLMDSSDNILGTWDNIAGLNDITSSVTLSEWVSTNLTPSYIDSTSFSVSGNNTSTFQINRRLQIVVSAGTIYGSVVSSTFSSPNTTVVIQPDSTTLDSGISSVKVGLTDSVNVSVPHQYFQANAPIDVASAATTNIGAALSLTVSVTGTTSITAFDTVVAGIYRYVNWTDATPIVYNATNMQLIASADRTNAAGDFSIFRSLGSGNWIEELYQQHTGIVDVATLANTVASGATAVTQAGQDNSTKIATDEYVDRQHDSQVFTGSGTWTKPSWVMPNTLIEVECWGGGGGGGHSISGGDGGGGGSGGTYSCRRFLASDLGATETVTVGAGGAGGTSTNGGTGGTTTFGSLVSAAGGNGGIGGAAVSPPAAGGAAVSNNGVVVLLWDGAAGGATDTAGTNAIFGGAGGGGGRWVGASPAGGVSVYGGNGGAGSSSSAAAVAGTAPGGGGGGGDGHNANGAAGASGEVRVRILS